MPEVRIRPEITIEAQNSQESSSTGNCFSIKLSSNSGLG
jgi:hypothetical protein